MAVMDLICGGVLERHPKLKVLVLECGKGVDSLLDGAAG
jgi:predicted TIM-barrel fold metal-dependent hydrolase